MLAADQRRCLKHRQQGKHNSLMNAGGDKKKHTQTIAAIPERAPLMGPRVFSRLPRQLQGPRPVGWVVESSPTASQAQYQQQEPCLLHIYYCSKTFEPKSSGIIRAVATRPVALGVAAGPLCRATMRVQPCTTTPWGHPVLRGQTGPMLMRRTLRCDPRKRHAHLLHISVSIQCAWIRRGASTQLGITQLTRCQVRKTGRGEASQALPEATRSYAMVAALPEQATLTCRGPPRHTHI
jgi:hypothetical protein